MFLGSSSYVKASMVKESHLLTYNYIRLQETIPFYFLLQIIRNLNNNFIMKSLSKSLHYNVLIIYSIYRILFNNNNNPI